jgi:PRC-barrel domain
VTPHVQSHDSICARTGSLSHDIQKSVYEAVMRLLRCNRNLERIPTRNFGQKHTLSVHEWLPARRLERHGENTMRSLLAATTVSLLLAASAAVAQVQTPPSPNAQVQTPPSPNAQVQTPPSPNAQVQTPPSPNAQAHWYSHQSTEIRASKLIGATVQNDANESIGKINEVILSKDGKVAAVVVGVGGFLGMGEREVALSFEALRLTQDSNGKFQVLFNATKDSLKAAPAWTWSSDDRSKTGGTSSTPSTKPMNPSK